MTNYPNMSAKTNNESHVGGQRKSTSNAVTSVQNSNERTQKDVIIRKNSSKNLLLEKQNTQ